MNERLKYIPRLTIVEVAVLLGVSTRSIENWYMFKRKVPDNEYAKILPDFEQNGSRQTRYWKLSDVEQLKKFRDIIPHGKDGIMGIITNKKGNN